MIGASETAREVGKRVTELRKAGRLDEACALVGEAERRWPGDVDILRAFSWCLWQRDIKPVGSNADAATWTRAVRAAAQVLGWVMSPVAGGYDAFDPTPFVVLRTASALKEAGRSHQALRLLHQVDPSRLAVVSNKADFDPPRTDWFAVVTKILTEEKRWSDLTALATHPARVGLSGKNLKWIEYRLARAALHEGRPEEALAGFDKALRGHRDGWVRVLRAEILTELGRNDEALSLLRVALAETREKDFGLQIGGIRNVARLVAESDRERAVLHLRLVVRVLNEQKWRVKQEDVQLAEHLGVSLEAATDEEVSVLRRWWRLAEAAQRVAGTVKKVFENGGTGFVVADDGKEYYFRLPRSGGRAPGEGTRVTFVLVEGFDKKKNRATMVAQGLRIAAKG